MNENFEENSEQISNDDLLNVAHLHSGELVDIRLNTLSAQQIKNLEEMQNHPDVTGGDYTIAFFEVREENAIHFTKTKKTDLAAIRKYYLHLPAEKQECRRMKLKLN